MAWFAPLLVSGDCQHEGFPAQHVYSPSVTPLMACFASLLVSGDCQHEGLAAPRAASKDLSPSLALQHHAISGPRIRNRIHHTNTRRCMLAATAGMKAFQRSMSVRRASHSKQKHHTVQQQHRNNTTDTHHQTTPKLNNS